MVRAFATSSVESSRRFPSSRWWSVRQFLSSSLVFFFFLYAASAAAAFRGILNPNRCPAAAFASESLPSAVGVGSSCCPTQSHGEPTDSPPTNTRLAAPHAERRQPPAPNTPCTHASARTHTEASHCGICSFLWTRFGQRRSGERPHFK